MFLDSRVLISRPHKWFCAKLNIVFQTLCSDCLDRITTEWNPKLHRCFSWRNVLRTSGAWETRGGSQERYQKTFFSLSQDVLWFKFSFMVYVVEIQFLICTRVSTSSNVEWVSHDVKPSCSPSAGLESCDWALSFPFCPALSSPIRSSPHVPVACSRPVTVLWIMGYLHRLAVWPCVILTGLLREGARTNSRRALSLLCNTLTKGMILYLHIFLTTARPWNIFQHVSVSAQKHTLNPSVIKSRPYFFQVDVGFHYLLHGVFAQRCVLLQEFRQAFIIAEEVLQLKTCKNTKEIMI